MMEEQVLLCEDSLEGIFTAVFEAYEKRCMPEHTRIVAGEEENYRLFAVYEQIAVKPEKAVKVMRTLESQFGEEAYLAICRAIASENREKADAVYHTIAGGLQMKNPRQVMGNLANDAVRIVYELSRNVQNEIHHLKGFVRFQELEQGILLSRIGPANNILTFLAPHFADRLPQENFMIYDHIRNLLVIHPANKQWYVRQGAVMTPEKELRYSPREKEYQELFRCFCHSIAIKERKNLNLQRQMLPLRFQKYMLEFEDS